MTLVKQNKLTMRRAQERGVAEFSWLKSFHTFSFGSFNDPAFTQFGPLRVINEDRVNPGAGFATHSHQNMEIITYVIDGVLEHRDSIGNGSVIKPGDIQRMSAGTGISHSELNGSDENSVHFLQIWIIPDTQGLSPSYEDHHFEPDQRLNQLRLVASTDGREQSIVVHQDMALYASILEEQQSLSYEVEGSNRGLWLQLVRGQITVNHQQVLAGDGVALESPEDVTITGISAESEFLLFDLPV